VTDAHTAVIFPGQGAQKSGMGAAWRESGSWSLVADLSEHTGVDVEELLLSADDETLRRTDLAQIAVFAVAVIGLHSSREAGAVGTVAGYAGHSLGEYVALYAAGALPLESAAKLVAERGRAMLTAARESPGTMAVLVRADDDTVAALISAVRSEGHQVWLANLNAPGQRVVSGSLPGIGRVAELAADHDAKAMRIPVSGAFHSPLMSGAVDRLTRALSSAPFADRHAPVVANVDARVYTGGDTDWSSLAKRQIMAPVRWEESVLVLNTNLGCGRFVEIGPGATLSGMVRRTLRDVETVSVTAPEDLATLTV